MKESSQPPDCPTVSPQWDFPTAPSASFSTMNGWPRKNRYLWKVYSVIHSKTTENVKLEETNNIQRTFQINIFKEMTLHMHPENQQHETIWKEKKRTRNMKALLKIEGGGGGEEEEGEGEGGGGEEGREGERKEGKCSWEHSKWIGI